MYFFFLRNESPEGGNFGVILFRSAYLNFYVL